MWSTVEYTLKFGIELLRTPLLQFPNSGSSYLLLDSDLKDLVARRVKLTLLNQTLLAEDADDRPQEALMLKNASKREQCQ